MKILELVDSRQGWSRLLKKLRESYPWRDQSYADQKAAFMCRNLFLDFVHGHVHIIHNLIGCYFGLML